MIDSQRKLLATQAVDAQIDAEDAILAALPGERDSIRQQVRAAESAVEGARKRLEAEELEERSLEGRMREQEALLERLDAQTYEVKNQQAYEAIQHEIGAAREAGGEFESRALELLEMIDDAREALRSAEAALAARRERATIEYAELDEREKQSRHRREALLDDRALACEGVQAELMQRYDALRKNNRPTVVVLEGKSCPHCRVAIPAQRSMDVQKGEVHPCFNCKRLLFSQQALTPAE